jgi:hypothetical protein
MSQQRDLVSDGSNRGYAVRVESLEDRLLLSGAGHGDDGGKVKLPGLSAQAAVVDLNGDGKADLATLAKVDLGRRLGTVAAVVTQIGKGNGRFTPASVRVVTGNPSAILTGDFNNDGKADVAVAGTNAGGATTLSILAGDGKGGLAAPGATQTIGTLPLANVAAGDVNGDGAADLVSFDSAGNVYESLNNGTGTLLPAVRMSNPFGPAVTLAGFGDVDGDGRIDLLGVQGGQLLVNKAQASTGEFLLTFIPTQASTSLNLAGKRLVLADVNGDKVNDLVAIGDGSVNVALQTTAPGTKVSFGPWVTTTADVNPTNAKVADVDGDGKADIVRVDGTDGLVTRAKLVLISNGDGTFHKLVADDEGHGGKHGHGHDDDHDDHDEDDDDDQDEEERD